MESKELFKKILLSIASNTFILGCLLFFPAGTIDWPHAWIFLALFLIGSLLSVYGLRNHQGLLLERLKPPIQADQPFYDKILVTIFLISFLFLILLIPLDVFHWHLLPSPHRWVTILGLCLFCIGWGIIYKTFEENAFAAPVIKLQKERNQTVIETGPYQFVRHPMYAGAILFLLGIPLWLGSYVATLFSLIPIAILAVRILFEEQFLKNNLKGYTTYMEKVKYRLIPFVW